MSDPDRKSFPSAGWRGPPSAQEWRRDARPPETAVGSIEVRGDEAPRRVEVRLSPEDLGQLALQLGEHLRAPEPERPLFGALAVGWLERIAAKRVQPENERRLLEHLKPLFFEDEKSLTAHEIDALLAQCLEKGLSPSTVNKVRGVGRLAIADAQARKEWSGPNPFDLVRRRREPRRTYELLTQAELELVQQHLRPDRRRMFRIAVHLGLRPGELIALRKEDIDHTAGVIHVRRSHGRETTKTGHARWVPIVPAIAGDLLEARDESPVDLLFPAESEGRQRADAKLSRVLRTAMAAAGVGITSVTYKCRRKGCLHQVDEVQTNARRDRECDRCHSLMWPVPRVRPVRWYDLRHICATLHHRAGADPLCVSLALGHSVKGTTQAVYTHPDVATMRAELSKWKISY